MKISTEIASCSDAGRVECARVPDIAQKQTEQKLAQKILRKKVVCCKRKIKSGYLLSLVLTLISVQTRSCHCSAFAAEAHWVVCWACGGFVSSAVTWLLTGFQAKGENVLEQLGVCPQLFTRAYCSLQAPGFTPSRAETEGCFTCLWRFSSTSLLYFCICLIF